MSFDFNINAVLNYLKQNGAHPELQKETGQVFVVYTLREKEVPVFFLLRPDTKLLQMVAYLPYQLTPDTFADTARILHLLNRELDLPGFGMDETQKLMFYRCIIPCLDGQINKQLFNLYLGTLQIACDTFMHAIGLIVSGTKKVDEVIKDNRFSTDA